MLVSIVVPVYESPGTLPELGRRVDAVFADRAEEYELIFVDDGSPSGAPWQTLEALALELPRVRAIQLSRNFGQQPATLCGLAEARGDVVLTMDDDLQHAPEDIPTLLAHADHDIVIGHFRRKQHSLGRRLASRVKGWFDRVILGIPKGLQLSSFRLMSRAVVDGVLSIRTPHPFLPALMFHVSRDVVGVPLEHGARRAGRSGYSWRKLFSLFSNLLINNSSVVLRVVGQLGIAVALVSFATGGVVVYRKLFHAINIQGWASLLVAILFLGGLTLFSIGVVGEYLVRIIEGTEARPTYFVRRRRGGHDR